VRFLIDECLSVDLVTVAGDSGHEARHVAHVGRAGWKDWNVVRYASDGDFVIVTNNASDFRQLYAAQPLHAGLVILIPVVNRAVQQLQDIYGIGERMEQRLHRAGILTVAELWNATPLRLRRVWGGINGVLFHQMLHGVDIQPPSSRFSKSIGHQHVLEPDLRTKKGAHDFAQHLLIKAAERLRRGDYYSRRLGLHLSWVGDLGGWWDETDFHETRDTGFLLARLEEIWQRVPRITPLSVGVVLLDLVPADQHQPDLFAADTDRRQKLSPLVDRINDRYGRCSIGFGLFPSDVRAFKGHAAFHRVPERWEF
jgi:DNA polymerase-4